MGTSAKTLIQSVGLSPCGPADWANGVRCCGRGIYVVELVEPVVEAPIDCERVRAWLEHVPRLSLDGGRPTAQEVSARLEKFWWPEETVIYVGCTTRPLAIRLSELHCHVLGDRGPHRGGQWLKALRPDVGLHIWWAETNRSEKAEAEILVAFRKNLLQRDPTRSQLGAASLLPFANLKSEDGARKPHGIRVGEAGV